jgi:hypothetical protein
MGSTGDILGLPVNFTFDANGDYLTAAFQTVNVYGSPLVVNFDPPVPAADFVNVGTPQVEQALASAISGGGVTFAPFQS